VSGLLVRGGSHRARIRAPLARNDGSQLNWLFEI
jgi:hypothetical protein